MPSCPQANTAPYVCASHLDIIGVKPPSREEENDAVKKKEAIAVVIVFPGFPPAH